MPVVILTDGDAKKVGQPMSATAAGLKKKEDDAPSLRVEISEITFEHELARSEKLLPHLITAFKVLHPIIGAGLETDLNALKSADEKANMFLKVFLEKEVSKGMFAQELASVLEEKRLPKEAVPLYIRNALVYLGVVDGGKGDGQS